MCNIISLSEDIDLCNGCSDTEMCVLEVGASSLTCGCRSVWSGDECNQIYQVYIPDENIRTEVCDLAGYDILTDPYCDISPYEMANINGGEYPLVDSSFDIEGLQYLINVYRVKIFGSGTTLDSIIPISSLNQMTYIEIYGLPSLDSSSGFNSLTRLMRLQFVWVVNNNYLYDVSVFFRAIGMDELVISYASNDYLYFSPVCRSETDSEFWTFIKTVFPRHNPNLTSRETITFPNNCPINEDPGNISESYSCFESNPDLCPSVVVNEVYNNIVQEKQCAFIAKEGSDGECYTVHDDNIRQYLKDYCLSETDPEMNGIISVATMRSKLTCSSLSLSEVVSSSSSSVSTVDEITTLQGLEYAQGTDSNGESIGLTSLNIDGYDLSGDINENAEYDKLVVQILARALDYTNVYYGNIVSGLNYLSVSRCGIYNIGDILDYTPIHSEDPTTEPFKLTYLDLSNNNISDVSVLITSSMFPEDVLLYLDISDNYICDIEHARNELSSYFSQAVIYSYHQTCPCEGSMSFSSHKTCRQRSDGEYQVECWDGYYLDINTNECIKACSEGASLDPADDSLCVSDASVSFDNAIRCQVCEHKDDVVSIVDASGAVYCSDSCSSGWYGFSCDQQCPVSLATQQACNGSCFGTCDSSSHQCTCT
ncbi:hypothetical protein ADUPG1_000304, partial [Aduncisulcus paluster]